ncbi:hypothetical protein OK411_13620 [Pseudomonas sp. RG1]|uniref:hypothetical protein n=1 Tax=Pseudomonas sp. RG1 TaxID=2981602 RepID=UPI00221E5038|nr:hypothetical protein [Pseudomonas sp. RG1]MCW0921421.1 hypothetical protein [Pseudomonas sp. RG1]
MTNVQKAQLLRYFAEELAHIPEHATVDLVNARSKLRKMVDHCLAGTNAFPYLKKVKRQWIRNAFDYAEFDELADHIAGDTQSLSNFPAFFDVNNHKGWRKI